MLNLFIKVGTYKMRHYSVHKGQTYTYTDHRPTSIVKWVTSPTRSLWVAKKNFERDLYVSFNSEFFQV